MRLRLPGRLLQGAATGPFEERDKGDTAQRLVHWRHQPVPADDALCVDRPQRWLLTELRFSQEVNGFA